MTLPELPSDRYENALLRIFSKAKGPLIDRRVVEYLQSRLQSWREDFDSKEIAREMERFLQHYKYSPSHSDTDVEMSLHSFLSKLVYLFKENGAEDDLKDIVDISIKAYEEAGKRDGAEIARRFLKTLDCYSMQMRALK